MTGLNIIVSPCGEYFSSSVAVDVRGFYDGKETTRSCNSSSRESKRNWAEEKSR